MFGDVDKEPNFEHYEFYNDQERRSSSAHSLKASYRPRPFVKETIPDEELPFIEPDEVAAMALRIRSMGLVDWRLWVVIDNVVYDCTGFQHEHPGGKAIIQKFSGQCCGWQFWRFHNRSHMEIYGRKLRVGRTFGVKNRYREPARYVGLRKLGDEWYNS